MIEVAKLTDYDKARRLVTNRNASLVELAKALDINVHTLRGFRYRPERLERASWETVHKLALIYPADKDFKTKLRLALWEEKYGKIRVNLKDYFLMEEPHLVQVPGSEQDINSYQAQACSDMKVYDLIWEFKDQRKYDLENLLRARPTQIIEREGANND